MAPSFSQVMDTEVEVINSQSNLAGEPCATVRSLGGLVNAGKGREKVTRALDIGYGSGCVL